MAKQRVEEGVKRDRWLKRRVAEQRAVQQVKRVGFLKLGFGIRGPLIPDSSQK